tara:strand:+ start:144 stop:1271 length:1128 start_codon:yes stop_codon:yes gene_type:complete
MEDNFCSPKSKKLSGNTCFDNKSLLKIINYHSKSKNIDYGGKRNILTNRQLLIKKYNKIKSDISKKTGCKEEHCLLKTPYGDDSMENNFRPEIPQNWYDDPNTWLSTTDIEEVLKQYEEAHPELVTVVTPLDWFAKDSFQRPVSDILQNLNIEDYLKKGKSKLGVVFNLDPHYEGGSHWTALYCDFMKGFIYYFDSYAVEPEKEIQKLMQKIKTQGNKLLLKKILKHTDISKEFRHTADIVKKINSKCLQINNLSSKNAFSNENIIFLKNKGKILSTSVNQINEKIGNGNKIKIKLKNVISCSNCDTIEQISFQPIWNSTRFQYEDSECGVFSIYFLEQLIEGKSLKEIIGKGKQINDVQVNKKRFTKYYRPSEK